MEKKNFIQLRKQQKENLKLKKMKKNETEYIYNCLSITQIMECAIKQSSSTIKWPDCLTIVLF